MEDFSTPRRPLLPVATNLCTLAVVLMAAGWSAAQRSELGTDAAPQQQSRAAEQPRAVQPVVAPAAAKPVTVQQADSAHWTTLTGSGLRESATVATLQPVGYQATSAKR